MAILFSTCLFGYSANATPVDKSGIKPDLSTDVVIGNFYAQYSVSGKNINGTMNVTYSNNSIMLSVDVHIHFNVSANFLVTDEYINRTIMFERSGNQITYCGSAVYLPFVYYNYTISHYKSVYENVSSSDQLSQSMITQSGIFEYRRGYYISPTRTGYVSKNDLSIVPSNNTQKDNFSLYNLPSLYLYGYSNKLLYMFSGNDPVFGYILNLSIEGEYGYFHPPLTMKLIKTDVTIPNINWLYVVTVYVVVGILEGLPIIVPVGIVLTIILYRRRKKKRQKEV